MTHLETVDNRKKSQQPDVAKLLSDNAQQLRLWIAARVPRNDIEDVSQEVCMRVWEHCATKFDGENFRAWLFQIARNYLVDRSRRRRPEPLPHDNGFANADGQAREPYEILIDREYRSRFAECLAKLEHPRRAIVEAKAAGDDYDEVAQSLSLTKQQAYQHFFVAKRQLRACMNGTALGNA